MYAVKQFFLIEEKYDSLTSRSKNFLDECFELHYPFDPSPISYCPADVIRYIGYFLSIRSILNLSQVCKFFRKSLTEQVFLSELARQRLTEYEDKLIGCTNMLKEIYLVKRDGYRVAAKKGYEKHVIKYFKDGVFDLLIYTINPTPATIDALMISIRNKHLNVVQGVIENSKILSISWLIINATVDSNDIDIIEYIFSKCKITQDVINDGLLMAAYNSHLDVAKCLLNHGADVHYKENAVLFAFISTHNLDAVKYIIKLMNVTSGLLNNTLRQAFSSGNLEIIQYLISLGGDVRSIDGSDILSAIETQDVGTFKHLVSLGLNLHVGENLMAGILLADTVNIDLFDYFIEQGVVVDMEDNKAIVCAANEGNMHIFQTLIAHGANIRAQDGKCMKNACKKGHLSIVEYLEASDAGFHINDNIHLKKASKHGRLNILKYLAGRDRNIFVHAGEALIVATKYNHLEIVKFLVRLGANINIQDDEVLMKAIDNGNYDIIKYLLNPAYEDKYKYCYGYHQSYRKLSTIRSNIDARESQALILAISLGTIHNSEGMFGKPATEDDRLKIIQLLVSPPNNIQGINITNAAMESVVKTNQLKILKYLLSKRNNIPLIYDKLFDIAVKLKFQDIINYFIMKDPDYHLFGRPYRLIDKYNIIKLSDNTDIPAEIIYLPNITDINS